MPSNFQNTLFGLLIGCFVYHKMFSFSICIPTQMNKKIIKIKMRYFGCLQKTEAGEKVQNEITF